MKKKNHKGGSLSVLMCLLSFWFVSYQWTSQNDGGSGRTCVESKTKDFNIVDAEKAIAKAGEKDRIIITNFIQINKKTYDSCSAFIR